MPNLVGQKIQAEALAYFIAMLGPDQAAEFTPVVQSKSSSEFICALEHKQTGARPESVNVPFDVIFNKRPRQDWLGDVFRGKTRYDLG